jgi:hypothetical protein
MPPSWREYKKLVRKLDADARPAEQALALDKIAYLCVNKKRGPDFLAAGAVPSLIYLLGPGHPADVQMRAAAALAICLALTTIQKRLPQEC